MTAASSSRYYSMCTIWSAKEKLAYTRGVSTNYVKEGVNVIMKSFVNFYFYEIRNLSQEVIKNKESQIYFFILYQIWC